MSQTARPSSPNIRPRHHPVLCGRYSRLELEVIQQLKAKDLQKCLTHCQHVNLNERRAGLCNLLIYLRRDDTQMTEGDVQLVRETLKRFFPERNSKLYRLFLEVLHDFIQLYCEQLETWVEAVLRRLLDRLGSETLSTLKTLIMRTVLSLQHCYMPGFLFRMVAKAISRNQSITHKSQLAFLDYLGELLPLLQPEDFYEHSDLEACLKTLATDLSTTNAPMRIKIQDILSVLFDLNPTTFNLFLSRLPVKLEDSLARSIRRHWAKVIENEHLSPRKTFRTPPDEGLRGMVYSKGKLGKQRSLTDLMQFPSDSDEQLHSSYEDVLSQSCSAHVLGRKYAHSLALQQPYDTQQLPLVETSQFLIPPSHNSLDVLPPIPTLPPPDIPASSPPGTPILLPPSMPPDLPTTSPPDIPTSPPPDIPTSLPLDLPTILPPDIPTSLPLDLSTILPPDIPTSLPPDIPTPLPNDIPTPLPPDISTPLPPNISTPLPNDIPTPLPPDIPTPLPTDIPSTILPLAIPTSLPPDIPTSSPPDLPTALPPDIPNSPSPDIPASLPIPVIKSLPFHTSHIFDTPTSKPEKNVLTPSRIPVSIRTCPRLSTSETSRLVKVSLEHRSKRRVTLSPTLKTKVSRPSSLYLPSRGPSTLLKLKTDTNDNPRTFGKTPSKIPRFTGNTTRHIPDSTSGGDGGTPLVGGSVRSSDTSSTERKEPKSRVCLNFEESGSVQRMSIARNDQEIPMQSKKDKIKEMNMQSKKDKIKEIPMQSKKDIIKEMNMQSKKDTIKPNSNETSTEADSAAATNSSSPSKSVHSTSLGSSLHLIPSESLEEDSSAQMHSHSCHELRTESAASLDSEGEVRLSYSHSLKQLLCSFLSAGDMETKVQTMNELRETLLTHTLIPLHLDTLHPTLSQVVTEMVSFSTQLSDRAQLVSMHTLHLLSQLATNSLLEHSETLAKFFLAAHASASHLVRIKLENLFLILAQGLDLSIVISLTAEDLRSVTINYLTPLKLLAKLIPHTPTHILSTHLHMLAPAIIRAYTGRVGIQNAALPCLVGLYNCLDPQMDAYLKGLSPAQDKLLMMYVKSSSKKRES